MTVAVRCGRCGVRYDGKREKCPKCGGRSPQPVVAPASPARAAAGAPRRRSLAIATGAGALVVTIVAGWAWIAPTTSAAASATASTPSPLARLFVREQPRRLAAPSRVPSEIAFVDSPAAGHREYDTGSYDAALDHFRAQMEERPSDAEPHSNAGQVLVRLGRTNEALPLLQKAADLDPARWAYRFNLARAEGLLGHWDKAAADYAEAAKLFPGDYATLFNLGQALHRAGREEEAVAQYRQAIEQNPDDSSFYLALGVSEEKLGHHAEAAAAYRHFVSMEPSARQAVAVTARATQLEAPAGPAK